MSDAAAADEERHDEGEQRRPSLPVRAEATAEPEGAAGDDRLGELRLIAFSPSYGAFDAGAAPAAESAAWNWRRMKFGRLAAAASLTAVVAIGAAAAASHVHALRVAQAQQAHTLARRLDTVTTRLDSLEAKGSHDDLAGVRKVLAEIKSNTTGSRDVNGAVAQLAQRMDRLEKDQTARLDKLGDRLDHDTAARMADMTARLEKLEAKAVAPTTVAVAKAPVPTPPKPEAPKPAPQVSYETTAAIDRTHTRMRNYYLADIRNGYALIGSPGGEFAVGPGDPMPGGGRVLRIERRGREWVVVTTVGQIQSADD